MKYIPIRVRNIKWTFTYIGWKVREIFFPADPLAFSKYFACDHSITLIPYNLPSNAADILLIQHNWNYKASQYAVQLQRKFAANVDPTLGSFMG